MRKDVLIDALERGGVPMELVDADDGAALIDFLRGELDGAGGSTSLTDLPATDVQTLTRVARQMGADRAAPDSVSVEVVVKACARWCVLQARQRSVKGFARVLAPFAE